MRQADIFSPSTWRLAGLVQALVWIVLAANALAVILLVVLLYAKRKGSVFFSALADVFPNAGWDVPLFLLGAFYILSPLTLFSLCLALIRAIGHRWVATIISWKLLSSVLVLQLLAWFSVSLMM